MANYASLVFHRDRLVGLSVVLCLKLPFPVVVMSPLLIVECYQRPSSLSPVFYLHNNVWQFKIQKLKFEHIILFHMLLFFLILCLKILQKNIYTLSNNFTVIITYKKNGCL